MRFVLALIGTMFALDIFWWAISARIAKPTFARIGVTIFALAQLAGLIWLLTQRFAHAESMALFSKFAMATVFIWHMIFLPLFFLLPLQFWRFLPLPLLIPLLGPLRISTPPPG